MWQMKLVVTFYKHAFLKISGNLQRKVSQVSLIFHILLGNSIKIESKVDSLKTFIFVNREPNVILYDCWRLFASILKGRKTWK